MLPNLGFWPEESVRSDWWMESLPDDEERAATGAGIAPGAIRLAVDVVLLKLLLLWEPSAAAESLEAPGVHGVHDISCGAVSAEGASGCCSAPRSMGCG